MEESKREALHNRLFYLLNNEEEELKEKKCRELQLKREKEARKIKIVVKSILDLTEKYECYDIKVNICKKIITLRKPLEVKYLAQFRHDCNYLGFKFEIGNRSIEDMYYRSNYI